METVIVLGATAGIARPLCFLLAASGCRVILCGRDQTALAEIGASLREQGRSAEIEPFDALDFDGHATFFGRCLAHASSTDTVGVILCYGYLPDQSEAERDFAEARRTIDINYTSAVSLLNHAANVLVQRGSGYIAAISSVAGDRGRRSNYLYGSAKAGLSAYLQGLRARLHGAGIPVLTVKPGYVATKMVSGRVRFDSPLVASPERVARSIDRAIRWRRNVIYTPWWWRPILCVARALPEVIAKRLRF